MHSAGMDTSDPLLSDIINTCAVMWHWKSCLTFTCKGEFLCRIFSFSSWRVLYGPWGTAKLVSSPPFQPHEKQFLQKNYLRSPAYNLISRTAAWRERWQLLQHGPCACKLRGCSFFETFSGTHASWDSLPKWKRWSKIHTCAPKNFA